MRNYEKQKSLQMRHSFKKPSSASIQHIILNMCATNLTAFRLLSRDKIFVKNHRYSLISKYVLSHRRIVICLCFRQRDSSDNGKTRRDKSKIQPHFFVRFVLKFFSFSLVQLD